MKTRTNCPKHKVPLVRVVMVYCPACRGSVTSKRKAQASKRNGRKGGRPVGSKDRNPRKRQTQ
jgi:hypothetical protein